MRVGQSNLEEFLVAILRGAAKILGCNSTDLIVINERSQEIRVQLGVMMGSYPIVEQLEQLIGSRFKGFSLPLAEARDSLVYQSWRDQAIRETSSVQLVVGSAFPPAVLEAAEPLIGELRFICVPAVSGTRNYGVLLFTKEGKHPFSRQQREVLLRYARRIGEMLENDMMGQHQDLVARPLASGPICLLFAQSGELLGQGPRDASELPVGAELPEGLSAMGQRAQQFARAPGAPATASVTLASGQELELSRFVLRGEDCVFCMVHPRPERRTGASLERQLMQLSLGEAAPALFLDPEFTITSCNFAAELLLGYSSAELLHQPVDLLFREPREMLRILRQQVLDPADPYCEEAAIVRRKDGSLSPASIEALVLANDKQQVVGFLVLVREGAAAADGFAGRLAVQERLATMGEMATQLAHEIRNPLLAIGATLNSLSREQMPDEHRTILAALGREIGRLDMLLKDYLAVRHDSSYAEVSIAEVVSDAARLLEGARKAAGKLVCSEIERELTAYVNYDAIKHVLFNLLLNALEASPTGGQVTCRAVGRPEDIAITIEDQGSGLGASPAECFRPFFTTKKNGTGLGLAVCQKIARAHGGLVELRNREEGGCQAVLILPRHFRPAQLEEL